MGLTGFGVPAACLGDWAPVLGLPFPLPSTPDPRSAAPQVVFRKPLQSLQAEEGASASLQCELSEPGAAVVWSKGGLEVQADERRELRQRGRVAELVLRGLRREDTGEYTCSCGSQATSATLSVTGGHPGRPHPGEVTRLLWGGQTRGGAPPARCHPVAPCPHSCSRPHVLPPPVAAPVRFLRELQAQEVDEGATARLRCELSRAGSSVEWRKGSLQLFPCAKYQMVLEGTAAELLLHGAEPEDAGLYTCDTGHAQSTAYLSVRGEPPAGPCPPPAPGSPETGPLIRSSEHPSLPPPAPGPP